MMDNGIIVGFLVVLIVFIFFIVFQLGKRFPIPQTDEKTLEELLEEKQIALDEEEYEKVIILNKKIKNKEK